MASNNNRPYNNRRYRDRYRDLPPEAYPKRPAHPNKVAFLGFLGVAAVIFFAKEGVITPVIALAAIAVIVLLGYILYLQYRHFMRRLYPDDRPRSNYQFVTIALISLETLLVIGALAMGLPLVPVVILGLGLIAFVLWMLSVSGAN